MDYALLALLKAEQLERQGQQELAAARKAGLVFECTVAPNVNFEICTLKGDKDATLIVCLQFEGNGTDDAGGTAGGKVEFRLGGKTVFDRPFSQTMMFMTPVSLSGKQRVAIRTSKEVRLVSADIMLMGGEIINEMAHSARIARHGDTCAAVCLSDGKVLLSVSDSVPNLSDSAIVGFGQCASVAGLTINGATHFAVCFAGTDGDVYLSLAAQNGQMLSCYRLPIMADNLALIGQDSHLVLGYVYKGIAYASLASPPDFSPGLTTKLEQASSIEFVRDCNPPAVILGKSKGSVIRMAQAETASEQEVALVFEC